MLVLGVAAVALFIAFYPLCVGAGGFPRVAGADELVRELDVVLMVQNLHAHSVFCDGKNTPEEMIPRLSGGGNGFGGHQHPQPASVCERLGGKGGERRAVSA